MGLLESYPSLLSLLACILLATIYVASLYVWNSSLPRSHPSVIKKRTVSVMVVMMISPFITRYFITDEKYLNVSMWELHGFRKAGLWPATILPLLLTMTLFLGPICMEGYSTFWEIYTYPTGWLQYFDATWLRNSIVAPLSEEFTFRACMLPLLLQHYKPMTTVFICPLFFGLAHIHHIYERLKSGIPLANVLIMTAFQFCYTYLFGAYSALLFVKTGHFISPFIAHSFCNMMGFPDFDQALSYKNPLKTVLVGLFILGVVLWCCLLPPLTSHTLYENNIYGK